MDDTDRKKEELKRLNIEKQEKLAEQEKQLEKDNKVRKEKAQKAMERRNQKSFWEQYQDYFAYGALGLVVLFILVSSFTGDRRKLAEIQVNEEEYITSQNDANKDLTLGTNPFWEGATLQTVKEMANNKFSTRKSINRCNSKLLEDIEVPNEYNFYAEHPTCRTDEVLSRGSTSYTQVPISLYRNRNCRAGGDTTFIPSLSFLHACDTKHNSRTKGGYIANTLDFISKHGIINEECWNEINPVDKTETKDDKNKKEDLCPDADALKKCTKDYIEKFCVFETIDEIKKEIKKNGPVASFMLPYRDLLVYKSGVYEQEEMKMKIDGIIFVKLVGWETNEDGSQSWLVDPMFGREYGIDGMAKVKMGTEESLFDKIGLVIYPSIMEKAAEVAEEAVE